MKRIIFIITLAILTLISFSQQTTDWIDIKQKIWLGDSLITGTSGQGTMATTDWVLDQVGAVTSFTNMITEAGGTVKFGGTTTENTSVLGASFTVNWGTVGSKFYDFNVNVSNSYNVNSDGNVVWTASGVPLTWDGTSLITPSDTISNLDDVRTLIAASAPILPLNWVYALNSSITDSRPGIGLMRLNNATPANVTQIYIDDFDENSFDQSKFIQIADTNSVFYIQDFDDEDNYYFYKLTGGLDDTAGYTKYNVTYQDGSGSIPFDQVGANLLSLGSSSTADALAGIRDSIAAYNIDSLIATLTDVGDTATVLRAYTDAQISSIESSSLDTLRILNPNDAADTLMLVWSDDLGRFNIHSNEFLTMSAESTARLSSGGTASIVGESSVNIETPGTIYLRSEGLVRISSNRLTPESTDHDFLNGYIIRNDIIDDTVAYRSDLDTLNANLIQAGKAIIDTVQITTTTDTALIFVDGGSDLNINHTDKIEFNSVGLSINSQGADVDIVDARDIGVNVTRNVDVDAVGNITIESSGGNTSITSDELALHSFNSDLLVDTNTISISANDSTVIEAGSDRYVFDDDTLRMDEEHISTKSFSAGGGDIIPNTDTTNDFQPVINEADSIANSYGTFDDSLKNRGHHVSVKGETVYEIYSMSDFPSPVLGLITLNSGKYVVKKTISTADSFLIANNANVTFGVENSRGDSVIYSGSGTLFSAVGAERFAVDRINIYSTGNNATIFNIDSGDFNFDNGELIITGTGTTIGTIANCGRSLFRNLTITGFTNGVTLQDLNGLLFNEVVMQSNFTGSGAFINIIEGSLIFGKANDIVAATGPNESFFYIDPTLMSAFNITNSVNVGLGDYFADSTTSGTITAIADQSVTAASVTSVADNGSGKAEFTSTSHGLSVGEIVIHTTFSESTYNGVGLIVTAVPTANTYDIGTIDFIATGTGQLDANTVQITSTAHGLSDEDKIRADSTIDYNGGYKIFNSQANTFEINAIFTTDQTGYWDDASLDEKSKYVNALNNGVQKDSRALGSVIATGNSTATTITTQDVYVDLNLNALAAESRINELWTIINTTTGEVRYDGIAPINVNAECWMSVVSAGSAQQFSFKLIKNDIDLPSPDLIEWPVDIGTSVTSVTKSWNIEVNPGDELRIQVENNDGTSNVTVSDIKINIQ